jgi:hypothetical protein
VKNSSETNQLLKQDLSMVHVGGLENWDGGITNLHPLIAAMRILEVAKLTLLILPFCVVSDLCVLSLSGEPVLSSLQAFVAAFGI